jgi:hypothetical protein
MRRLLSVLVTGLLAAGALAGAGVAKEANLELSSSPTGTKPGEAWDVTLTVFAGHDEAVDAAAATPPVITIRNVDTGERLTFTAGPSDVPLEIAPAKNWDARVVFPSAGTWDYEIDDGWTGRVYQYDPVVIASPVVAAPAADRPGDGQGAGFPVWPFAGGLAAALVAAFAAVLTVRRRRLGAA